MKRITIGLLVCALASIPALAQQPHNHGQAAESSSPAAKYFTDVELINQDGQKLRFYSDVLKGKTVIVNAFFTSCTSVCPPMNRKHGEDSGSAWRPHRPRCLPRIDDGGPGD